MLYRNDYPLERFEYDDFTETVLYIVPFMCMVFVAISVQLATFILFEPCFNILSVFYLSMAIIIFKIMETCLNRRGKYNVY